LTIGECKKLTEADKYALSKMPDGWFKVDSLPYTIRCPYYRCKRLHEAGYLDYRVVGEIPYLDSEYRKLVLDAKKEKII
jgi:hypothetical protein